MFFMDVIDLLMLQDESIKEGEFCRTGLSPDEDRQYIIKVCVCGEGRFFWSRGETRISVSKAPPILSKYGSIQVLRFP